MSVEAGMSPDDFREAVRDAVTLWLYRNRDDLLSAVGTAFADWLDRHNGEILEMIGAVIRESQEG